MSEKPATTSPEDDMPIPVPEAAEQAAAATDEPVETAAAGEAVAEKSDESDRSDRSDESDDGEQAAAPAEEARAEPAEAAQSAAPEATEAVPSQELDKSDKSDKSDTAKSARSEESEKVAEAETTEAETTEAEKAAAAESTEGEKAPADAAKRTKKKKVGLGKIKARKIASPSSGAASEKIAEAEAERHRLALAPLYAALEAKNPVRGRVIGWNKGGFHVAIGPVAAFCPVSQIEAGNPRGPKRYVDRTFDFMVIEIQKGGRRVVVSRAAALKAERESRAERAKEILRPGAKVKGKVSSLTNFGAFIALDDGIEGLVHVSEISRQRVEHPKERLKVGQEVEVQVLKLEKGGERISLSMKRLEADPWKALAEKYPSGSEFEGVVRRKTEFGLFVELEPGVEGLVHTSRLPIGKSMDHDDFAVDSKVEGWVQDVEPKRRRIALSLRELPNQEVWKGVEDRFPVGGVYKGQVERVADFGAFVQLEPGLTGLLPFSELKQRHGGVNLKRQYHAGKEVSVRVLSIDAGRRRISLGTESSTATGTQADFRDYMKQQRRSGGMGAMAAAFAKLQEPHSS